MNPFSTTGFVLAPWQRNFVELWRTGDRQGPFRATLEIFTGGGKTLIALACAEVAAANDPGLRLAVVVPTEALARQWRSVLLARTSLSEAEIGLMGAGGGDSFDGKRALVCVINTASRRLPEIARGVRPLMLVVDECHRAGAPSFSRVLDTEAGYVLGLSATPDREEIDDETGELIEYDSHLLGRRLGEVRRFGLAEARKEGWLPEFEIHHHGLSLRSDEQRAYDRVTREIDSLGEALAAAGGEPARARQLQSRADAVGDAARAYLQATARRKDLLYRATERHRIARHLVKEALDRRKESRILLFHERVAEAEELFSVLHHEFGDSVGLEHSRLSDVRRTQTMEWFRDGTISALVSVKSLVEGIDVPAADIGISVAATSSVRQRIQSLGRVLRRGFEPGQRKHAVMHLMYVENTVDNFIYGREDWSDLTGADANRYWFWPLDPDAPSEQRPGPPRTPRPTEDQEWERLGRRVPTPVQRWQGDIPDQEYTVDTRGTVTTPSGAIVANPQDMGSVVEQVRGRPGGRFFVTPSHRLVILWSGERGDSHPVVAAQLEEPFGFLMGSATADETNTESLKPGDRYPGPLDHERGKFALRQKLGGVIERRGPGRTSEFALAEGVGDPGLLANARAVLDAWRAVSDRGISFSINKTWHAWYLEKGEPRFLAAVPGGFIWPPDIEE